GHKDQSYMLYRLGSQVLPRLILPLADFASKDAVRSFVRERGLDAADQKDSQEICFLPPGMHYADYLASCGLPAKDGDFVDLCGNAIGKHRGASHYTVGQRKNLGTAFGKPMFVVGIDAKRNRVVLGENDNLFSSEVFSSHNFFAKSGSGEMPKSYDGLSVTAKIRYAAKPAAAVISDSGDGIVKTVFDEPQRAAAPGQSIVFYSGSKVVGGGVIEG
ncbi:MAG: tRNA 2-thiouridine(34) synthase MnmA, partial [Clostridiales bacterium]|nr:tRNA 2-thiouridine(34) synthase MnmA [Clostridiales bacterium]